MLSCSLHDLSSWKLCHFAEIQPMMSGHTPWAQSPCVSLALIVTFKSRLIFSDMCAQIYSTQAKPVHGNVCFRSPEWLRNKWTKNTQRNMEMEEVRGNIYVCSKCLGEIWCESKYEADASYLIRFPWEERGRGINLQRALALSQNANRLIIKSEEKRVKERGQEDEKRWQRVAEDKESESYMFSSHVTLNQVILKHWNGVFGFL